VEHRIIGTTVPVLELMLQPGESVLAESGEVAWVSMAVQLRAAAPVGGQGGGLRGALSRGRSASSLLTTEYTAAAGVGMVAFCARLPGRIVPLELQADQGYVIHRHGFVCATPDVRLRPGPHHRLGAGMFGGTELRTLRITGPGTAFVELHGEVVDYDLPAGNMLRVHPGHVGMFEDPIQFDVAVVPGVPNAAFGGDELYLATLTGPGRVWLQSMCLARLGPGLTGSLGQTRLDGRRLTLDR
jgi:uncharacterized protein (AIM24 family)